MKKLLLWIIDDEPGMIRAVERSLSGPYQIESFLDPQLALESLNPNQPPDIAIVDIRMPGLDGFQVLSAIKQKSKGTDVILMTGSMTEPDAHLTRALREKAFYFLQKPFDRDVLRTLVQRCVELRHLSEENRRHTRRLEEELREAKVIQKQWLPEESARLDRFRVESHYQPCAELGGDFFDFVELAETSVTVLVADASGHGASAAMMNALVKAALHGGRHAHPRRVVERIAEGIESLGDDRFITVFCARLDAEARTLEYVNAGHPPALRVSRGRLDRLTKTGPLLSPVLSDGPWELVETFWEPNDRLLLYTDGVVEVAGDEGHYGESRLTERLCRCPEDGRLCLDSIVDDVHVFAGGRPIKDDLTLAIIDAR